MLAPESHSGFPGRWARRALGRRGQRGAPPDRVRAASGIHTAGSRSRQFSVVAAAAGLTQLLVQLSVSFKKREQRDSSAHNSVSPFDSHSDFKYHSLKCSDHLVSFLFFVTPY